jgi:hypothetical protein
MVFIYVLRLKQGKYYIGKTNNPQVRIKNHFNSNGAEWTKIYKPIQLIELIPGCDHYDEDKITRQYMDKYGIENVRGGSFVTIKLEKSTIDTLNMMRNGTNDYCFVCGCPGHFAKDCSKKAGDSIKIDSLEIDSLKEVWICCHCGKDFNANSKCKYHEKYCCPLNKKCIFPVKAVKRMKTISVLFHSEEEDSCDSDNETDSVWRDVGEEEILSV